MSQPRAKTKEELQEEFLDHIHGLVVYWDTVERTTCKEKLDGLAFSILNIFDGTSASGPAIDLVMRPHPDNITYHQEQGDNWTEDGTVINDDVMLHELWCQKPTPTSNG